MSTPAVVLFDLDGTLSASGPGIIGSLRRAMTDLRLPLLDPALEQSLLGPPFHLSLPPLVGEQNTAAVLAGYRSYYRSGGMFETHVYDGVLELLSDLSAEGRTLAVATSKPEEMAAPIVEHLGLSSFFRTVCGDTLDGQRSSKALVIAEALRRLGHPPAESVVMVGDREHDVLGAREHAIACLGVSWGYGLPGELERAGAAAIYDHAADLRAALIAPA